MSQYSFNNNQLNLSVVKSPFLVRLVLYTFTSLCFALPLMGIIWNVMDDNHIKFIEIVALGVFSLIGFYMLRVSLWNHYGKEMIEFKDKQIRYIADYHWFKDGEKIIDSTEINYYIKPIGYESEKKGVLVMNNGESQIESVVKLPMQTLEEIVFLLQGLK